jgi:S1-C subfamily serine protease
MATAAVGSFMLWAPAPCWSAVAPPTIQATVPRSAIEAQSLALTRAHAAVVGLNVTAIEDARSAATLGLERQGSGVVIGSDDVVLTIGYLVLEAQTVDITTDDGRRFPGRVLAYDQATGFGLVQSLAPMGLAPVALGDATAVRAGEPLVLASGGAEGGVSTVQMVSRRAFSGYWEYHVEAALFTSPPRRDHAGAALFSPQGELLGIGSLFVANAPGTQSIQGTQGAQTPGQPGNMFVPVDLLRPVLAELRHSGSSRASTRAWMGLNCSADGGQVRVMRVNDDSPADVAGLQRGDHIQRIDGVPVADLAALWKTLWAAPAAERAVRLDIERDGRPMTLTVHAVDRAKTWRRAPGI